MDTEQLAVLVKEGKGQGVPELWERVKLLLYKMANRFYRRYGADFFARRGVTISDLEQECFLAMLEAVRAFAPERGYKSLLPISQGPLKTVLGLFWG